MPKNESNAPFKGKLKHLPDAPGVYKYFDKNGHILYIGKAKSLKKRVSSYFNKQRHENRKTSVMVNKVYDLHFTVVPTELDALLLENSLIKEYQPKYNINLKDDKSFPLIRITNERFPKVLPMRNPVNDGSEYFGPYANVRMMKVLLDLCKQLYPTRNCNLNLSKENIDSGKFKVCMEYQIGNCRGPCENLETEAEYLESIEHIKFILRGNLKEVRDHLKGLMKKSADDWNFEKANSFKKKLDLLDKYQSKSTVVNPKINDVDVLNLFHARNHVYINYMRISGGIIVQSRNLEIRKKMDESDQQLLESAYVEISNYNRETHEILVPVIPEIEGRFKVPKSGDRKKLLNLSYKNASLYGKEKVKQYEKLNPDLKADRILNSIKEDLKLKEIPYHMECFDNSNIQGKDAVSACVVFKNAKASKKDYRHFNIKTVEGPDDFSSMYEVISRRYTRLLEEGEHLPQLVVVDGGKGQLSSAVKALRDLGIYSDLAIIGIAKRLEEIYYPEDPLPLYIDKKSETLRIIQQMRDEAHRFGITHHRQKRSRSSLSTELTEIEGIGSASADLLLRHFRSIKKITLASSKELEDLLGPLKAKLVYEHYHKD